MFVSELFCASGRAYLTNVCDESARQSASYDVRHHLFLKNQTLSIEEISCEMKEKIKGSKLWNLLNKMLTIINALKAGTESFGDSVAPTLIKFLLSQGDVVDSNVSRKEVKIARDRTCPSSSSSISTRKRGKKQAFDDFSLVITEY